MSKHVDGDIGCAEMPQDTQNWQYLHRPASVQIFNVSMNSSKTELSSYIWTCLFRVRLIMVQITSGRQWWCKCCCATIFCAQDVVHVWWCVGCAYRGHSVPVFSKDICAGDLPCLCERWAEHGGSTATKEQFKQLRNTPCVRYWC